MTTTDDLKLEIWFINMAIRKAFTDHEVTINDITWNPRRGGLANAYFNIHSIQVTIGPWQESIYRIETTDIRNYSAGVMREGIDLRIQALVHKYLRYAANRMEPGRGKGRNPRLRF